MMIEVASWIREHDQPLFEQFAVPFPAIRLANARIAPLDLTQMRGLVLTGGPDVSEAFHPLPLQDATLIRDPEPERDAWEFEAVRHAYQRGLPILCVCKGLQLLNLALGGTLHLHIPGHDLPEMKSANVQPLRHSTAARHRFEKVNSSHHQALCEIAHPLEVEAWHAGDDVVEQVRIRDYPWGMGVQYHPERDTSHYMPLFNDFFSHLTESGSRR